MDRLLLYNSGRNFRPNPLHYRLCHIQQTYRMMNLEHFLQVNCPAESSGKEYYLDLDTTPFIYFRNVQDFTK
jgi:hypothetical protein